MFSKNNFLELVFILGCSKVIFSSEISIKHSDYVLCRLCGYNIAPGPYLINILSPAAEDVSNQTLFGLQNVEVQKLRNSIGIEFNIVLTTGGTCIGRVERWKSRDSWFPGYLWKACFCVQCSTQIGWIFEPIASAHDERVYASKSGFYALILEKVISEDYSNSLLAAPRISPHNEL